MEVVEVAGVRIGIAARQVTDGRRCVGSAVACVDVDVESVRQSLLSLLGVMYAPSVPCTSGDDPVRGLICLQDEILFPAVRG